MGDGLNKLTTFGKENCGPELFHLLHETSGVSSRTYRYDTNTALPVLTRKCSSEKKVAHQLIRRAPIERL